MALVAGEDPVFVLSNQAFLDHIWGLKQSKMATNRLLISPLAIAHRIAAIGFILLFPGFMFYHHLVGIGVIPPFLGGMFSIAALFVFVCSILIWPFMIKSHSMAPAKLILLGSFALLLHMAVWAIIYGLLLNMSYSEMAAFQSLTITMIYASLLFTGSFLPMRSKSFRKALTVFFVLTVLALSYYFLSTGKIFFNPRYHYAYEQETVSTYQGYAMSVFLIALYLLSTYRDSYLKILIILTTIPVLFVIGARSELYAFVAFSMVVSYIYFVKNLSLFIFFVVLFTATYCLSQVMFQGLEGSRQFAVFEGLDYDESWGARLHFQSIAIRQILQSPILGHFGGHVEHFGSTGSYAHNILSVWVNYGLLGFLIYAGLVLKALITSGYKVLFLKNYAPEWFFAFGLGFVSLLLILTSKSFIWSIPALSWGAYINARLSDRDSDSDYYK